MRKLLLLSVLALGATGARAENGLFYLGAGVSYNSVTNIADNVYRAPGGISAGSWKAFVGVRPLKWLATEADYMDLGNGHTANYLGGNACLDYGLAAYDCNLNVNSHGSTYAGYLVGFLPTSSPNWEFFAKAGAAHWMLSGDFSPPVSSTFSRSGTNFAWGIGLQAHVNKVFGARLEYERINIPDSSGANIVSLSLLLNF
jgi:hypothetical protein